MELQDVMNAADALVTDGIEPTLRGVRARLGGGSFSDIGQYLKVWRTHQRQPLGEHNDAPVPDALSATVSYAIAEAWKTALQMAHSAYETRRQSLEAERPALRASKRELAALADSFAGEAEAVAEENGRLKSELARMERLLFESAGRLKLLQELLGKKGTRASQAQPS